MLTLTSAPGWGGAVEGFDGQAHALGQPVGVGAVASAHDGDEFLAAPAGHAIGGPAPGCGPGSGPPWTGTGHRRVAVRIVVGLEVVDVDHGHGHRRLVAQRTAQLVGAVGLEMTPVGQAGRGSTWADSRRRSACSFSTSCARTRRRRVIGFTGLLTKSTAPASQQAVSSSTEPWMVTKMTGMSRNWGWPLSSRQHRSRPFLAGHVHVQQDQVWSLAPADHQGLLGAGGHGHVVVVREDLVGQVDVDRLVVDDQQPGLAGLVC